MQYQLSASATFFSVAFMWCWVASARRSPLCPQAGLILFYGIERRGNTAMMDYTADPIDAEAITVCLTQGIGLGSVCTSGIQRNAGVHMQ